MPAEHKTPGGLRQGYFCMRCGDSVNMLATGHDSCKPNPVLVDELIYLNKPEKIDLTEWKK